MNMPEKFSKCFEQPMDNKCARFFILAVAGILGVVLFKFCGEWLLCLFGVTGRARDYLVLPMLSFFVFVALWFFRTHDTRQRIEQANQQMQQEKFNKGMDNLVSDNPLRVDIGVALLLEASDVMSAFDKEIRIAFIKRLKELPEKLDGRRVMEMRANRLSYAQYIIQWLINHPRADGAPFDLRGMDCRYQEFTSRRFSGSTNQKLEISKILSRSPDKFDGSILNPGITFEEANCENVSFKGVSLGGFDFTNAINVDITGGYVGNFNPCGLGKDKVLSKGPTGEILKNPNWTEPGSSSTRSVMVRQRKKTYPPDYVMG